MERKPPLNSELAARKFESVGIAYPGVVVAVVTPDYTRVCDPDRFELPGGKLESVGIAYPGVVVAVVTPVVLNTFPLLMAKLGWLSTLKTSTFALRYFASLKWKSLPSERFHTPNPGLVKLFRLRFVLAPGPVMRYLAV